MSAKRQRVLRNGWPSSFCCCPCCNKEVPASTINIHLDLCLSKTVAIKGPAAERQPLFKKRLDDVACSSQLGVPNQANVHKDDMHEVASQQQGSKGQQLQHDPDMPTATDDQNRCTQSTIKSSHDAPCMVRAHALVHGGSTCAQAQMGAMSHEEAFLHQQQQTLASEAEPDSDVICFTAATEQPKPTEATETITSSMSKYATPPMATRSASSMDVQQAASSLDTLLVPFSAANAPCLSTGQDHLLCSPPAAEANGDMSTSTISTQAPPSKTTTAKHPDSVETQLDTIWGAFRKSNRSAYRKKQQQQQQQQQEHINPEHINPFLPEGIPTDHLPAAVLRHLLPQPLHPAASITLCTKPEPASVHAYNLHAVPNHQLQGQSLLLDFITAEEEQQLLQLVDTQPPRWHQGSMNGSMRGKAWGVRMDLQRRTVSAPLVPMPPFLLRLAERMRQLPLLAAFHPSEANALEYGRGVHALFPHVDDRQLSTDTICNLSLAGACIMTFAKQRGPPHQVRVLLPPRCLQILRGDARYRYTHAIHKEDVLDARRVSITFRQSPLKPA